jgi:thiamine kinase-like enzyme
MTARAADRAGFGPAVRYAAPGVMVTEFLDAQTWTASDVAANPARVAGLLAAFHRDMQREVEGPAHFFWPFHVIRDYGRALKTASSPWVPELPLFMALSDAMEAVQIPMPVAFGHHDLLPANILETPDRRLWLIDFEHAGFGTAMFDLAGAASNAGMDDRQSRALIEAYLGRSPDLGFIRAFDAMQVASLLREAMWAMVSDIHLAAPGVDYKAYAEENISHLSDAVERYQSRHGRLS